jgi:uncharacterized heparinase superfamily protein
VSRATAAHSTVTLNETSSCRFIETPSLRRLLFGVPIASGPRMVTIERGVENGEWLRAAHDGYVPDFGIVHSRAIRLSPDGRQLDGEDRFTGAEGRPLPASGNDEYAIRFHLHPAVKASRLSDGYGVILLLPDREVWTFNTYGDTVELEESVFLSGSDGPRRTVQIVIYGKVQAKASTRWCFRHSPPVPSGTRASPAEEPQLPL